MPTAPRRKRGWIPFEIVDITKETHDAVSIKIVDSEDRNCPFDYFAGQYLTFRFDDLAPKPIIRSYTMSSSPCESGFATVTVKETEDGFISKYLVRDTKVGDTLKARGPIGKFCYQSEDEQNLVCIAAGSGVTPFISMAREFQNHFGQKGYPKKLKLIFGYRTQSDIIFHSLLEDLAKNEAIDVHIFLSREKNLESLPYTQGRVQGKHVEKLCSEQLLTSTYMSCGPQAMTDEIFEHLQTLGVDAKNLKQESFSS